MEHLYVAYGSNLHLEHMGKRCPEAVIYGKGLLKNWELVYRGSKDRVYATIRRKRGKMVPVVVWKISEADEKNLDLYEDYPKLYFKQNVIVDIPQGRKKAMVYIMDKSQKPGVPSEEYISTIRQGYIDNDLDSAILEQSLSKINKGLL